MRKIFSKDLLMKLEGIEPTPQIPDEWLYIDRINEAGASVRTLYHYNNTIGGDVVTVPYGHTELQDYQFSSNNTYATLPFYNHQTITSVDLKNVPFRNGNMEWAFGDCHSLITINNINNNITSMIQTFVSCTNFNQNIQIPNSVTNLYATFVSCANFNQNIQIPNSVTTLQSTFSGCTNFNQNIQIPNSVTDLSDTFSRTNFNHNIQIPNSVTSLRRTFRHCNNFNQNIQIPNSVTNLLGTFDTCVNLNQFFKIPNSVTSLYETFMNCISLEGDLLIHGANISSANYCFYGTTLTKYVTIPYRYINNTFTSTRNAFNSAGYITGTNGILSDTINGVTIRDFIASPWWFGYSTYTGNGTHWILQKWNGASDYQQTIDVSQTYKNVTVPQTLTTYDTFPTAITNVTFAQNSIIENLDCNNVPLDATIPHATFANCYNLKSITNLNIPDTATNMQSVFINCRNITENPIDNTPSACTQVAYMYKGCTNLGLESSQIIRIGQNVANYRDLFNGCSNLWGDIYFYNWNRNTSSNRWNGWWTSYNTQRRKNLWCYFTYQNGVNTPMYNYFKGTATYNNNATSNFYLYNIGVCPV